MIIMLFMAITSTGSAECIAVSSLVAYDIYREYINKNATGSDILRVSRITILVYGILQGALAALLQNLGIGIGWMYNFMGIMIGSAVWPIAMLVLDSRVSAAGAMAGAIVGNIAAVIAWIAVAAAENDGAALTRTRARTRTRTLTRALTLTLTLTRYRLRWREL